MQSKSRTLDPETLAANLRVDELKLFTLVAKQGSFSAAAQLSGLSQSTVSKRIKKLEVSLNLLLFDRSARDVVLTDIGEQFLRHCQVLLENFDTTLHFVQTSQEEPSGEMTIAMPPWMAMVISGEFFARFHQRHPKLKLTILFATRERLIEGDTVDVYFGLKAPLEGQFKLHPLAPMVVNFYASQTYLDTHPPLQHPDQLIHHECLCYRNPYLQPQEWRWLDEDGEWHPLYVSPCCEFEYIAIGIDMARYDGGVIWAPHRMVEKLDTDHRLVAIFGDKYASRLQLTAIHPHYNVLPPKLRVFIAELSQYLKDW